MKRVYTLTESKLRSIIEENVRGAIIAEGQKMDNIKQNIINLINKFGVQRVAIVLGISAVALLNQLGYSESDIDKDAPVHISQNPNDITVYQDGSYDDQDGNRHVKDAYSEIYLDNSEK